MKQSNESMNHCAASSDTTHLPQLLISTGQGLSATQPVSRSKARSLIIVILFGSSDNSIGFPSCIF
jgi:hypothetical protein